MSFGCTSTELVAIRVLIYSISSQKLPVVVSGALEVVPTLPDEGPTVLAVVVSTDDEGPGVPAVVLSPGPEDPNVSSVVVIPGPDVPDDPGVAAVVLAPGPVVVSTDSVGPRVPSVVSAVDDEGPGVPVDEDGVLPPAQAITDNVTSFGPLLSVVFVTFITISVTVSVGKSSVGNEVGAPCIGATSSPDSVVKVTSISATLLEYT